MGMGKNLAAREIPLGTLEANREFLGEKFSRKNLVT
jgi:hypothetical protein